MKPRDLSLEEKSSSLTCILGSIYIVSLFEKALSPAKCCCISVTECYSSSKKRHNFNCAMSAAFMYNVSLQIH